MTVENKHIHSKEMLSKYFPEDSIDKVYEYIKRYNVSLTFTRKRLYKLGDYKSPSGKNGIHRITVNGDLNPYSALLVFLHELSHLLVWNKHKNKVKPHGKEWKEAYGCIVRDFIEKNVFPFVLQKVLEKKLHNLKASFSSDNELFKTLSLYDDCKVKPVFLEEIPEKTIFLAKNGKKFIKQNKLRKRFRCLCLENKRTYLFHPLAQIKTLNEKFVSRDVQKKIYNGNERKYTDSCEE